MAQFTEFAKNLNNNRKGSSYPAPPGSFLNRFIERVKIHLEIGKLYRFGWTFVKDQLAKNPVLPMNIKHTGQVCVLTGGTRGIGIEIVKNLLKLDYTLILGVRNLAAMNEEIAKMRKSGITSGNPILLRLDLKSLTSVRQFANQVLQHVDRIDLLINHAGVYQSQYEVTENGLESHFQVNYLSHFLLTQELLPCIKATAEKYPDSVCHIINTSSAFEAIGNLNFDNLAEKTLYEPIKCYCDTKLCGVVHVKLIQEQLTSEGIDNIQMYAVHPGEIPTEMWQGYGKAEMLVRPLAKLVCQTPKGAADLILYPALNTHLRKTCGGKYFYRDHAVAPNSQADNPNLNQRLWQLSIKLVQTHASKQAQHCAHGA